MSMASDQVNRYLEIFPELKTRLSKFGIGIFKWNMVEQVNIDNPEDVLRIRRILKVLNGSQFFEFFDNTFNNLGIEKVEQLLRI